MRVSATSASEDLSAATTGASTLSRQIEKLLTWCCAYRVNPRAYHFWFGIFLAAICVATILVGAVRVSRFGHDVFILLDNGWRVLSGQRPMVDYYSPLGPVIFLVSALGLRLSHFSPAGLGYANALFAFVIGLWAYALCRGRLPDVPRVLASLYLPLMIVAPFSLGMAPWDGSYAMLYNRYGYSLLGLILVECFCPRNTHSAAAGEFEGGCSTGVAAAIALFLKVTYFSVSLLLIAVALLLRRASARRLLGLAGGFTATALAFMAYLRFDLAAISKSLLLLSHVRASASLMAWVLSAPLLVVGSLLIQRPSPRALVACAIGTAAVGFAIGVYLHFDLGRLDEYVLMFARAYGPWIGDKPGRYNHWLNQLFRLMRF